MRIALAAASLLALAACGMNGTDRNAEEQSAATTPDAANGGPGYDTYGDDNYADTMASNDAQYMGTSRSAQNADGESGMGGADATIPDPEDRPVMQAQVVLDRRGFGPGVIDGKMGMSTDNALRGFQEATGIEQTGKLDEATKQKLAQWDRIPATRVVTIPANWGSQEYYAMPDEVEEKAKMERLGYTSLDERLAERFHTTVEVLKQLNPNGRPAGMSASGSAAQETRSTPTPTASSSARATPSPTTSGTGDSFTPKKGPDSYFTAGQQVRVPNIGGDRIVPGAVSDSNWQRTLASLGVGTEQGEVDRIVVSKAGKTLKAYRGDKLVGLFTVTSGSSRFPLPLGEWDIVGEAYNPPYSYDPEVLGLASDGDQLRLPPGPNSPVGVIWIDLSKEHYGIHGTPDPETIGRAESSGCVRLTNWDAARLAQMVSQDTEVIFEA